MKFRKGDIVKVVDFSNNYPDTPIDVLAFDHPYRKLGEGECLVLYQQTSKHVSLENLKNGMRNSIYAWRCVLASKSKPDWEV
jgi:hypothetical protein